MIGPMRCRTSLERWGPAAALVALAAVAYAPALRGGFVFDDHLLVQDDALLRGPLWRIWFSAEAVDYWPLTWTSFWAEWRLWGPEPAAYHLTNVLLHAGAAVLLWRVLRALSVPGAWLGAALFAVHPVAAESVAWIAERKNTLSGLLFFGAALAWLRHLERRGRAWWTTALALFALALAAKASTVVLPVVLLGVTAARQRLDRRALRALAPFFLLTLCAGAVTIAFQRAHAMAGGWAPARGAVERLGGAAWALLAYAQHAFLPVRLAFVYPPWPVGPGSPAFFVPLALVAAAAAAAWWARRRARAVGWALGYLAVCVLPVLGLVEMAYLALAPIADHLEYLALAGPCALAGHVVATRMPRRPAALAAAALLAVLAAATFRRAATFESDLTLWRAAAADAPRAGPAHFQLAAALLDEGDTAAAIGEFQQAGAVASDPGQAARALMLASFYAGQRSQAVSEARRLLGSSGDPDLRRDAAWMLVQTGSAAEAVPVLEELQRAAPDSSDYAYWLGAALARAGRLREAADALRRYAGAHPGRAQIEGALSVLLVQLGRIEEARQHVAAQLGAEAADPSVESRLEELRRSAGAAR